MLRGKYFAAHTPKVWLLMRTKYWRPLASLDCCACMFQVFRLFGLTLKLPRKNESEKLSLLKLSAANNCLTLLTNLSIEANRVDPDQTASIGAVWSWSTLFVIEASS